MYSCEKASATDLVTPWTHVVNLLIVFVQRYVEIINEGFTYGTVDMARTVHLMLLEGGFRDEVPVTRVAEVVIVRVAYVLLQGLLTTEPAPASCTILLHADAEEEGGGYNGRVVTNSRGRSRRCEDHRLNI